MNFIDIIYKKKNGEELRKEEIDFLVENYVNGKIADYAFSSFLMAVCLKGLKFNEIKYLTLAMKNSGTTYNFETSKIKLDKHSTGGVSDTTTLAILPIMASLGYAMPKMSGRSLGYTGGTIDKLEVFENINVGLNKEEFESIINTIGCAITSQTENIAIADKKIYALRDVTGTVESLGLIASSIMSKKLAFNSNALILDVKFGSGALMKTKKGAIKLAKTMVRLGIENGLKTFAIISNMNSPLGRGIGCNLEVYDAIKVLKGEKSNLSKVVKRICCLYLSEFEHLSKKHALNKIDHVISSGKAFEKFKEMIKLQGGDSYYLEDEERLKDYNNETVNANLKGYITKIDALKLAKIVLNMGGGRVKKEDVINNNVGIQILVDINSKVDLNTPLFTVFSENITNELKTEILSCFEIKKFKTIKPKLIYKII